MAKVGFWLRGARGKLAGSVLSKGANGQTIARELVVPKNPKSDGQMAQRMIFATAQIAYSLMKSIANHSYEGVQYGAKTQQAFVKDAVAMLRARAAMNEGNFLIPNVKALMANPYTISKGSLSSPTNIDVDADAHTITVEKMANPQMGDNVVVTTKSFCDALGINKGDQITLVAIGKNGEQPVIGTYDGRDYRTNEFVYGRITVRANAADDEPVVVGESFGSAVVTEGFNSGNGFYIIDANKDQLTFNFPLELLAFACIRSVKDGDNWLRSTETMNLPSNQLLYNFDDMLEAWLTSGTTLDFANDRYLNNAEAENAITPKGLTSVITTVVTAAGEQLTMKVAALSTGAYEGIPIGDDNSHPYILKDNGHVGLESTLRIAGARISLGTAEQQLGRSIVVDQN